MKRTRRDKGTGTIRQRKDGRWEARFLADGQDPIFLYGKTRQEVQNKLFAEQRQPNRARDPEGLTVGEWLDRWLEIVRGTRRFKTYDLYNAAVENHIKPHVGSIRLGRLSKAHIYDMLDALKKEGVGDQTVQKVYKILHRALQVALQRDKVTRNVASLVDTPTITKKERIIFRTEDEVRRFRKAVRGSVYEPLYLVALDTGCRQGELLALKWENVDLAKGLIHIKATLTENEAGELVATPPKTASSRRTVKLAKNTIELLREYRKLQMDDPKHVPSVWVFPNWDGGPMRKDGYLRRELPRLLKEAKLPRVTFHGLRHTHATMLAALGAPVPATQERLGHSTSRMTLEVYTHATAAMQDQAVSALDRFYERAEDDQPCISGQISGQIDKTEQAGANEIPQSLTG